MLFIKKSTFENVICKNVGHYVPAPVSSYMQYCKQACVDWPYHIQYEVLLTPSAQRGIIIQRTFYPI